MARTNVSVIEKGGATFHGIKLLLCENPLPPIDAAIAAAHAEVPRSNTYTEMFSAPLRDAVAHYCGVPIENVHINAGSELILRQLVSFYGARTHLMAPTFALFDEIAPFRTHTFLSEADGFSKWPDDYAVPPGTTLAVIVNPNNPNGAVFEITERIDLLERHPGTMFLVDEAFIEFGGTSVADLVPRYPNLIVTRTFSKGFSLAGFRVGYAIAPVQTVELLNATNDAYPLARPSQAAAIASLENIGQIRERAAMLKSWTQQLSDELQGIGIETFPTETYFFLAKVPGVTGDAFARELEQRGILLKPLHQPGLGDHYVRFTTSTPENNARALEAIRQILD